EQIRLRGCGMSRTEWQGIGERSATRPAFDAADKTRNRGRRGLHHQDIRGEVATWQGVIAKELVAAQTRAKGNSLGKSRRACGHKRRDGKVETQKSALR